MLALLEKAGLWSRDRVEERGHSCPRPCLRSSRTAETSLKSVPFPAGTFVVNIKRNDVNSVNIDLKRGVFLVILPLQ